MIAKSVILNVIRQAEKHLKSIPNEAPIAAKRKFIRDIIQNGKAGNTVSIENTAHSDEGSGNSPENSGFSSGSGQYSGNEEAETNLMNEAKENSKEKHNSDREYTHGRKYHANKGNRKGSNESKNTIVKQLVKEMARAAIQSLVVDDSHIVVKKSDIAEVTDGRQVNKRSKLSERDIVNESNNKDVGLFTYLLHFI